MKNQLTYTNHDTTTADRPPLPSITPTPITPERPRIGRRWILVAGGTVVAVAAAVTIWSLGGESAGPATPAAVQRPAYLIIQNEIDAALAEQKADAAAKTKRPAQQIIQDEIDAALAEQKADAAAKSKRPAYQIIQDEIDAALARKAAARASTEG